MANTKAQASRAKNVQEAEATRRKLLQQYSNEPKVPVSVSPLYAPHFGNNMQIAINGVTIVFPVDGSTHEVPKSFAAEIIRRRESVDAQIKRADRMANIANNAEAYPGAISI